MRASAHTRARTHTHTRARDRVIDATLSAEGSASTKQFCAGAAIIGGYGPKKRNGQSAISAGVYQRRKWHKFSVTPESHVFILVA